MKMRNTQQGQSCDRREQWAKVALCLSIVLAVGYGIKRFAEAPDVVGLLNPGVEPTARVASLGERLALSDYRLDLHQVGSMTEAEFTLVNNGSWPVRDIGIQCDFYDRSGEQRGSSRWVVYDTIGALSEGRYTVQEKRFISPLVDPRSTICRIVDVRRGGSMLAEHHTEKQH